MQAFIAELRRRNVLRVAAFYAAAGWLLVQVVTQVLPVFDVSALAQKIIVLMIVAGFPLVLVLSWVYELTPQGIVKTGEVAPDASITRQTGHKLNRAIIAVLSLAVLVLLARLLWPRAGSALVEAAAEGAGDKSIAVLPFENLSRDPDNAYFAEGIQDEILTRLSKIGALKVISRTSTQQYAAKPGNLSEIGKALGVANLLEGSVQKAGDAVHINVQLIRAASDAHLWAETYDRKLDNVFGVEGEVAGAIAQALNAKLSGVEQQTLAQKPTENPAAYQAYLRGVALSDQGYGVDRLRKAVAAYTEATRLDPGFALAWLRLAMSRSFMYFNGVDTEVETADAVREAADQVSRLRPGSGEAELTQGYYRYRVLRDYPGAQQAFAAALQSLPNDAAASWSIGLVERRLGLWDQALAHMERGAQLDPRNAAVSTSIGAETLTYLNRYDEARTWLKRSLDIDPDEPFASAGLVSSYQAEGRLEDAAALLAPIPERNEEPVIAAPRGYQRLLERHYDPAIAELQADLARPAGELYGWGPQLTMQLAEAQMAAGQTAAARATAGRLITQLEPLGNHVDETDLPTLLALAYAYAGRDAEALKQARRAIELFRRDAIHLPTVEWALARVQAMGGDHAAAVALLKQLLDTPNGVTPALLKLDPAWDSLRGDAGFQKLVAEAKLNTFGAGEAAKPR